MKYKNILLGLGSFATIVSPISTIIACGETDDSLAKILSSEQTRVNKLTSSSSVTTKSVDAQVAIGTTFNEDVATTLDIDFNNFKTDKFNYTYQGSSGGIIITVKLKEDLSLISTINPALISIKYVSSTIDKIQVETTHLNKSSFSFVGASGSGRIALSSGVDIPKQIKISYAKVENARNVPSNGDYTTDVPDNLSNNDIIYIKFAIKDANEKTHDFPSDFIHKTISKIVSRLIIIMPITKKIVNTTNLVNNSFEIKGTQNKGTISLKDDIVLPEEVEPRYYVGNTISNEDNDYKKSAPTTLNNGNIVFIKFFIKDKLTYQFPPAIEFVNPINILVSELTTLVLTNNLKASSFSFLGTQSSGRIASSSIPEQVEVSYIKSDSIESLPNDVIYSLSAPNDLSNGDFVHIKFSIKQLFKATYKFPSGFDNKISKPVLGLDEKEVDIINLKLSSFSFEGTIGSGKIIAPTNIPKQVEVFYKVTSDENTPNDDAYSPTAPIGLSNGNVVHIKFAIRDAYKITHGFSSVFTKEMQKPVLGLKILVLTNNLKESSFTFTKVSGSISVIPKNIPKEVQVSYAKVADGVIKPLNLAYTNTLNNLLDNDILYIKFTIKKKYKTTHDFPNTFTNNEIRKIVSGQKTLVPTTDLITSSFLIEGTIGSGKIIAPTSIPKQVEVFYKVTSNENMQSDDSYNTITPTDLSNGDVVHIKFAIQNADEGTHDFPSLFPKEISKRVSGLKTLVPIENLKASSFSIEGTTGLGRISLKDGINLPEEVEPRYYVGGTVSNEDNYYKKSAPTTLNNGDKVFIKFFIKNKLTYQFPPTIEFDNPIEILVLELTTLVVIDNLKASSFSIEGTTGSGKIIAPTSIPEQVEISYVVTSDENVPNDDTYSPIIPIDLSNGDVVHIKFAIQNANEGTHDFPSLFPKEISKRVSGLKTPVLIENLIASSFSFEGITGSGKIITPTSIPEQVEVFYVTSDEIMPSNYHYRATAPIDLSNGDVVHIKFAIQNANEGTHDFPSGFTKKIKKTVSSLPKKEVDITNLINNSFEIKGTHNKGIISLNDGIDLPEEVEPRYYVGNIVPDNDIDYKKSAPTTLNNGDKVFIKFFIKNKLTYQFPPTSEFTNLIEVSASGLIDPTINTLNLNAEAFEFSGITGAGKISLGSWVGSVSKRVEVSYEVTNNENVPNDDAFSATAPTDLSNGNVVHIKFTIKLKYRETYKFPSDFTSQVFKRVSRLTKKKVDISSLTKNLFGFSSVDGNIKMILKPTINIPEQVEVFYLKQANNDNPTPDKNTINSPILPDNLLIENIVYIKFAIKTELQGEYDFPVAFTYLVKIIVKTYQAYYDGTKITPIKQKSWIDPTGELENFNFEVDYKKGKDYKPWEWGWDVKDQIKGIELETKGQDYDPEKWSWKS